MSTDDDPGAGGGAGAIAIPSCRCDEPSVEKTVTKESANKGRRFFGCAKGMSDGCGFFEWAEEGVGASVVPQKRAALQQQPQRRAPPQPRDDDNGPGRRCDCDLTAVERTTTKEGELRVLSSHPSRLADPSASHRAESGSHLLRLPKRLEIRSVSLLRMGRRRRRRRSTARSAEWWRGRRRVLSLPRGGALGEQLPNQGAGRT